VPFAGTAGKRMAGDAVITVGFKISFFGLAVVAGLGLQISPFLVPGLGRFLGVIPLNIGQWGIVFASSVLMFIIIEISKSVFRLTARTSKT